jgi:hypothetical protein
MSFRAYLDSMKAKREGVSGGEAVSDSATFRQQALYRACALARSSRTTVTR